MAIAEGSGARFAYKFYSSGTMTSNAEADTATDPGATGGQILRRVSASLNLRKNATRSAELLSSRQVRSSRHTSRRVEGTITGELSPLTYFDLFEAAHRDTAAAGVSLVPATGHVRRKLAIERFNEDLDMARLYTECRVTGYRIQVPAEGIATVEFSFLGRNRKTLTGAAAPYFTAPADATSTNVCNALEGSLSVDGTPIGVVTSAEINLNLSADAPAVLGQAFPPDILLGTADVSGTVAILLDDSDFASTKYEQETEFALQLVLTDGGTGTITIDLPRIKLNSADEQVQGEASQVLNCTFQALENTGTGIKSTIQITDSVAAAG